MLVLGDLSVESGIADKVDDPELRFILLHVAYVSIRQHTSAYDPQLRFILLHVELV
jgi:hypothetical protein